MSWSPSAQRGFTIVEVLVAVAISLILLLGVINIFNAGKQSYALQNDVARLQENARYALELLSRSISIAGMETVDDPNVLPFNTLLTTEGGGNTSDTISVQYMGKINCLGVDLSTPDPVVITDSFAIVANSLECNGTSIVDGIENMQILYGQDDYDHPGLPVEQRSKGIADKYIPYDAVTLQDDQDDDGGITSVRIAILASTLNDVNSIPDGGTYNLLNAPALGPFADNQIRHVFTRTILLRNYYNRPKHPSY